VGSDIRQPSEVEKRDRESVLVEGVLGRGGMAT